jgi:glycosyltransferase involved in cell wall biosynthesis
VSGSPSTSDEVTILIPAYMAEEFIDRTMRFARGQTHRNISILVSIDESTDQTVAIVKGHAGEDDRVDIVVHQQRLGWAGNVNFLLDRVATPFAFLYFHDDVIVPQYVERLLAAAQRRPDAASVHCTVGRFGGDTGTSPARPFDGPVVERLLEHFLAPNQGAPLRALLRTELTADLRIPDGATGGLWGNVPFLVAMVAAGPALAVDETLYYRWHQRSGGLTDGWEGLSGQEMLTGWRANIAAVLDIVGKAAGSDEEHDALRAATFLRFLGPLSRAEQRSGEVLFERPEDLHPAFADLSLPPSIDGFGDELTTWADTRWQAALRRKPELQP